MVLGAVRGEAGAGRRQRHGLRRPLRLALHLTLEAELPLLQGGRLRLRDPLADLRPAANDGLASVHFLLLVRLGHADDAAEPRLARLLVRRMMGWARPLHTGEQHRGIALVGLDEGERLLAIRTAVDGDAVVGQQWRRWLPLGLLLRTHYPCVRLQRGRRLRLLVVHLPRGRRCRSLLARDDDFGKRGRGRLLRGAREGVPRLE
mmetsp:Transcript_72186/g.209070  ORF Transcript_72186/g.209070 Transcript_72186/m.209070 type:complete len:204 (-) Transcript_72186:2386-2997(-)